MLSSGSQIQHEQLLPSIHPGYARLLVAHVRNTGVDVEELFIGNSLTWTSLLETQHFISFEQFRRLLLQAQALTHSQHIELDISSISQASSHGPLGYGALSAPTVRETFELVQKMLATRITIMNLRIVEEEEHTAFKIEEKFDLEELRIFVSVMLVASFLDLVSKTTGDETTPIVVRFPVTKLEDLEKYEIKFPRVAFEFGADCLEVVIPTKLLRQPCLTVDEFAYRNALRECEQLLEQETRGGALSRRVKTYLLRCNGDLPSLEHTASEFAMSVRTFIRKLKQEETSYQLLLDEVRKELVLWYLCDPNRNVENIADLVGYADTSNFSRVFKRWFGQTPTDFRKQMR